MADPAELPETFWLLDVEIAGRTYRWSTEALVVPTADGDEVEYEAGLVEEPVAAQGDEVTLQILDPDMDWPALARELELAPAVLRRWSSAGVLEQAEVFALGRVTASEYGAQGEPIEFDLLSDDDADLTMPDPTAVCDSSTWPVTTVPVTHLPAYAIGFPYPVIFGYPGWDGSGDPRAVVPVSLCQYRAADFTHSKILVADRVLSATQVYVEDAAYDNQTAQVVNTDLTHVVRGWMPCSADADLLGRQVTTGGFTAFNVLYPGGNNVDDNKVEFYAGFHPDYGGGHVRSAYDVIEFLLRTWGRAPTDFLRLRNVEELLSGFQVDAWLNDTDRPWEWILSTLVPYLPVVPRVSTLGRYLERHRTYATAQDAEASISVDRGEAERRGGIVWKGGDSIQNEITLEYRQLRTGGWTSRRILTGQSGQQARVYAGLSSLDGRIIGHPLCAASQARRWGVRTGDTVQVGWSWDDTTILRVGQYLVESFALPYREVKMLVRDGEDLRTGAVVLLSEEEMALDDEVAIVTEPPVVEPDGVAVTFRLPEQV